MGAFGDILFTMFLGSLCSKFEKKNQFSVQYMIKLSYFMNE